MYCHVLFHPLNVCLGAIQWLEDPGPATQIMGYFQEIPAEILAHKPSKEYYRVDDQNLFDHDEVGTKNTVFFPPSYTPGAFKKSPLLIPREFFLPYKHGAWAWEIPNRYKLVSESASSGRKFARTVQIFIIDSFGTMTVSKQGASVTRKLGE